ncbi:MAG: FAD-binding protein [Gracilibacteraceae bacterium]|jgi:electron transfer flavoprotein alpha subunit|nr:FAD-binding protein [Gracilibacteraceae bacterium]
MNKVSNCWIFGESAAALPDLVSGALELAESVDAVIVGDKTEAAKALQAGCGKVYLIAEQGDTILEDYCATIQALIAREKPRLFILKTTKRTRLIAGRLAAAARTSVITDITNLSTDGKTITGEHMVYGGSAHRLEKCGDGLCLALVGEGIFTGPPAPAVSAGEIIEIAFIEPPRKAKLLERKPIAGEAVNLAVAKKVVGIGRGIQKKEDVALAQALAQALGAEIACTRPIAEGENWLARERYIGVSGAMLKPDYYFAIGISGQIQHMVGVNNAKTIISINSDKNAPIFKLSDYGLVADLYSALPKLMEKL